MPLLFKKHLTIFHFLLFRPCFVSLREGRQVFRLRHRLRFSFVGQSKVSADKGHAMACLN